MKKLVLVATLGAVLAGCNADTNPFDSGDDKGNEENVIVTEDGVTIITDGNDTIIDGNGNSLDENGNIIDSGNQEAPGGVNTSSVSGVYSWDSSEDGDEGYWVIDSAGNIAEYDYIGDSFDNGPNCYEVSPYIGTLKHVSGATYEIDFPVELDFSIKMTFNSNRVDVDAGSEGSGFLFPSSLLESDFSPEC